MNIRKKTYNAWLHWTVTNRCNLNCKYCFFNPYKKNEKIKRIDIKSLIKTLEKTKKVFRITFTGGGEPFLIPNLVEACKKLTKKHYVEIFSNLTLPYIREFAEKINPKKVLRFHASLHINELEKNNLIDYFIENYLLLKKKGFKIEVGVVAYPPILNEVKEYKRFFKNKGIEIGFDPFIGSCNGKRYPKEYTSYEKKIFRLGEDKLKRRTDHQKICNAGYNLGIVRSSGRIEPCFQISKKIGNIYKNINFKKNLIFCPFNSCSCPLHTLDRPLFKKAIKDNKSNPKRPNFFYIFKYNLRKIVSNIWTRMKR